MSHKGTLPRRLNVFIWLASTSSQKASGRSESLCPESLCSESFCAESLRLECHIEYEHVNMTRTLWVQCREGVKTREGEVVLAVQLWGGDNAMLFKDM